MTDATKDIVLYQKYIDAARRAEGSELLPKVHLGAYRSDRLLLAMADAMEELIEIVGKASGDRKYYVYADYGYKTETCLYEGSKAGAMTVFFQNKSEVSTDGYEMLEVAYFAEDGEYVTLITERI